MADRETNPATPRYDEWEALRRDGRWPAGVPEWALDPEGRMSSLTAAIAVIEELRAALAAPAAQAAVNAPDHKQLQAMRDGAEHTASGDYFRARPKADDSYGRKLFQDAFSMGFYAGWSARGNYVAGWVAPMPVAQAATAEPVAWLIEHTDGKLKKTHDRSRADLGRHLGHSVTALGPVGLAEDAARYRKMRAWFLNGGCRMDIHPDGHMSFTTSAIVDAGVDALPEPAQQAGQAAPGEPT